MRSRDTKTDRHAHKSGREIKKKLCLILKYNKCKEAISDDIYESESSTGHSVYAPSFAASVLNSTRTNFVNGLSTWFSIASEILLQRQKEKIDKLQNCLIDCLRFSPDLTRRTPLVALVGAQFIQEFDHFAIGHIDAGLASVIAYIHVG